MIRAVAFDLDGTLIDTAPDLGAAANEMLRILGRPSLPQSLMPRLIGAGISEFVERVLAASGAGMPLTPSLRAGAEALFRKLYRQHLFDRSCVYPGVRHTLQWLASAGRSLVCITNKEHRFAARLLEAADLLQFFQYIFCADLAEDRKPSPNLLFKACARLAIKPHELLYVGDSRADIIAAHAAGCRVTAVTYGYQDARSLDELHPDGLIDNLAEVTTRALMPCAVA
jgi:phosphoglycolate phosphatase